MRLVFTVSLAALSLVAQAALAAPAPAAPEKPPDAAKPEKPPEPPEAPATPAEKVAPLPEPNTYHQDPPPVPEPVLRPRTYLVEVGLDAGAVRRPASGNGVHDSTGFLFGGHARVKILRWLDARIVGRTESCPFSYDDGALGLPRGTRIDVGGPRRVYLSAAAEPTWSPVPRLDLWAGVGIGWGRTLAPTLKTSGPQVVVVPSRAAVFVEVPLSLGVRYEILPNLVVVNVSGAIGFLGNQSGGLLQTYRTPGKDGKLVGVGGYPEPDTSWVALAGFGVLL